LAEIHVMIEYLRLPFERQLTDVDHGATISELGKIALFQPPPRRFIDMLAGGQKEAVAVPGVAVFRAAKAPRS